MNIQWIRVTSDNPVVMQFKYSCQDNVEWNIVSFTKKGLKNGLGCSKLFSLASRKISKNKYDDLQSLKLFIPPKYHKFYDDLKFDCRAEKQFEIVEDEFLYVSEDEKDI